MITLLEIKKEPSHILKIYNTLEKNIPYTIGGIEIIDFEVLDNEIVYKLEDNSFVKITNQKTFLLISYTTDCTNDNFDKIKQGVLKMFSLVI